MNNLYDYFNIWFAFLLDPIKPDDDPEKIISNMTVELSNKYDELISSVESLNTNSKKEVIYQKGKKHIRFSELKYNLNFKEDKIDLQAKIRVNPCILSQDKKAHHTKIWVIFSNDEPQNLNSEELSSIVESLEKVATQIKHFILHISKKYLNKQGNDSIYKIKMVNSSLHPKFDVQYHNELENLYVIDKNESTLEHFRQQVEEIGFARNFFKDLFILNEAPNPNDFYKNISSKKDIISWKIIKSKNYNTVCRVASEEKETRITSLSSIKNNENRSVHLYTEPLKKAIDMSETL